MPSPNLRNAAALVLALVCAAALRAAEVVVAPGPDAVREAQAAIDRLAAAGGGTVRLPAGRHVISAALRLGTGVTVVGVPGETVLAIGAGLARPLAADAAKGDDTIRLADESGLVVGDGVAIEDDSTRGFFVSTATLAERIGPREFRLSEPLVHDYRVDRGARLLRAHAGVGGWGVADAAVEDVVVEGNHGQPGSQFLDGCRGGGIYLFGCERVAIRRCVARGYHGDGISFQRCSDVVVEGCVAERNANGGLHPGSFATSCTIRDSVARDNGYIGLFVCVGVRHGRFENNTISGNGGCGISTGCLDTDNVFRGNRVTGNAEAAMIFRRDSPDAAEGAHRSVVEGNEFVDNVGPRPARSNSRPDSEGRACVVIEGTHWGLVFRGNRFEVAEGSRRAGILVDAASAGLTLADNRLVNVAPLVVVRPDAPAR
jgi:hypothetical protein